MMNSEKTIKNFGSAGRPRLRQKLWRPIPLCLIAALVCAPVGAAYAQEAAQDSRPAINELELQAGPRGLVLIITAAGPIAIDGDAAGLEKATAQYAQMRIKITSARSGLNAGSFDAPADIPVKNIVLKDGAGGSVEFTLTMRRTVNGPIMIRGDKNQVKILLTKDAQPELRWSASKGLIWSKASNPADSAQGIIRVEPPDMQKMEARASKDTNHAPPNKMFTVKEGGPQLQTAAASAPNALQRRTEVPTALPEDQLHDSLSSLSADSGLVRYKIFGRDPFVPLLKDTSNLAELPRVENLRLVGVLEDTRERIALLEDFTDGNRAFALRVSDPVEHGKVLRVHRDKVVFIIRDFDVSRSYTLSLTKNNAQGGRSGGR